MKNKSAKKKLMDVICNCIHKKCMQYICTFYGFIILTCNIDSRIINM